MRKVFNLVKFFLLITSSLFAITALAIRPEQIGGSQYAVGVVNVAQMQVQGLATRFAPDHIVPERMVKDIENLLLSSAADGRRMMRSMNYSPKDRRLFVKTIALLQQQGRSKGASVFMIGSDQAIAVDGHHRVRGQARHYDIMVNAGELWPDETKHVLQPMGRVLENGRIVYSLDLDPSKVNVVRRLPANTTAEELMRALLQDGKGVWQNPTLNRLGQSYFGEAAGNASQTDLRALAQGLGISNAPSGRVTLTPIGILPDDSWRSLLGYHFFDRGVTHSPIGFVDYVEFYVADSAREFVASAPGRYPALERLTNNPTMQEQAELKLRAAEEFDQLIAAHPELRNEILRNSNASRQSLASQIARIQFKVCDGPRGSGIPDCARFLSTLAPAEIRSLRALANMSASEAIRTPVTLSAPATTTPLILNRVGASCIQTQIRSLLASP